MILRPVARFALLASLAAPLACASAAGSRAQTAPTLVIKGELSYRLRIGALILETDDRRTLTARR